MSTSVVTLGGLFTAFNTAQIVPALSTPSERRAFRLLSVNYAVSDSALLFSRSQFALNLGDFAIANTVETGGFRVIAGADPLQSAEFMRSFANAHFGANANNAAISGSHQVSLHGVVVAESIQALVFHPDNTDDAAWNVDLFYEQVEVSKAEWARLRHRPSVETRLLGAFTV